MGYPQCVITWDCFLHSGLHPPDHNRKYSYSMGFYCNNTHLHHSSLYLEFVRLFDGQCWCHPSAAPVLIINTLYTPSRNIHTSYRCLLPSAPSALGKRDGCIRSPYFPPFIFYFFSKFVRVDICLQTSVRLLKADTRLTMGIKAALPNFELYIYTAVLGLALLWAGSWIIEASSENVNRKAFRESVKPGWHYFGRRMDVSDFEWVMWFTTFRNHILFALSGHVIFAKICSMLSPKHRSLIYMVYGCLAVLITMGWTYVSLILSHCIIIYSVALMKKKWLCFVAGLTSLATIKMEPFNTWQEGFVTGSFDLQDVLFYGGCGFSIMRCMSFALENCEKKDGNYTFMDLIKYNFYLPFFFFGPVMTFDRFHEQANNPNLTRKEREMWNITIHAVVQLGAILVVDVFFHYLYILTIPSDLKLVKQLSDWSLAGLAYSNLVYDWVKAAVMFGVINTVSRLDHLDPPQPPKCITMLYVFAETHFDRGINDWLCKYVYDYIGENHDAILKELLATICTFAVTTLWLGPCELVYIWSFFNCFGLNFELWVAKLFSLPPFSTIENNLMSEAVSRRIRGLFNAVNFWQIVLYNVLALNSLDFAQLVAKRLLLKGFPVSTLIVLFVTYCGVQLIKERERKQALLDEPEPEPVPTPEPGKQKAE
ncbi:hedgehog acyltransferase like, a isoform X2 [Triplophysa rosa]|nr:hedgehog acyltransferase like, a isoform X2 [Triplophysa rosa]